MTSQLGPYRQPAASSLPQKVFRPPVVEVLDDPLAAAKLGDTVLAAQTFQHDADLSSAEKCRRVARRMFFTTCVPVISPARISVSSSLL
jgi:hypothetical protein